MKGRVLLCVALALAAAGSPVKGAPTEIAGSVTARREGAVQVSFEPREGVGPALGDAVTFSTEIDGIRVDAGRGEVTEIEAGSVWVRVAGGRPGLGHAAVIRATGRGELPQPRVQPAPPPTRPDAARGPEYIDLPATLGTFPFASNPMPPGAVASGGRRLLRPADGWPAFAGPSVSSWRDENGPLDLASHFRVQHVAKYTSGDFNTVYVGFLWYPPGSGRGLCTPRVNRNPNTGGTGLISRRGDVRVIFNPDAFTYAFRAVPDLSALTAFAEEIFAQLEPFANVCRRSGRRGPSFGRPAAGQSTR